MVVIAPCATCKHFDLAALKRAGKLVCPAFPKGVPEETACGNHRHREPYPGDRGIRFEPRDDGKALE